MKKLLGFLIVTLFLAVFISAKPKCSASNNCCLVTKVSVSTQPHKYLKVINEPVIHPLYMMTSSFE